VSFSQKELEQSIIDNSTSDNHREQKIMVYRVLKLVLGSLLRLEALPLLEHFFDGSDFEAAVTEFTEYIQTQEAIISGKIIKETLEALIGLLSGSLKGTKGLHDRIIEQCLIHVHKKTVEEDIPFETFVKQSPLCQFLSQDLCIESWVRSVLGVQVQELFVHAAGHLPGRNVHSLHLLAFMRSNLEQSEPILEPSYSFMEKDRSVDEAELILQQCTQGTIILCNI
jgi:hypothetical protein